jgi:hypothetical protein
MQNAFWHHKTVPRPQFNGPVFEIDQEPAFDDIKEFVIVVVFVPVVFTLDHADPDNRSVDLAKRLIEPRHLGIGERFLINDLEGSVQDVESCIVREIFDVAHRSLCYDGNEAHAKGPEYFVGTASGVISNQ